jgi:hypothetical protein
MNLVALPAFDDHLIWKLHDDIDVVVADPGDAAPAHAAVESRQLQWDAILVIDPHAGRGNVRYARIHPHRYRPRAVPATAGAETSADVMRCAELRAREPICLSPVFAALREWKKPIDDR